MKIGILSKTANSINKDTPKNILNDTAPYIAAKGDPIANLQEDLAADKEYFKCNHK